MLFSLPGSQMGPPPALPAPWDGMCRKVQEPFAARSIHSPDSREQRKDRSREPGLPGLARQVEGSSHPGEAPWMSPVALLTHGV